MLELLIHKYHLHLKNIVDEIARQYPMLRQDSRLQLLMSDTDTTSYPKLIEYGQLVHALKKNAEEVTPPEPFNPPYLRRGISGSFFGGKLRNYRRRNKPMIRITKRLNRLDHKKTVSVRRTRRRRVGNKSTTIPKHMRTTHRRKRHLVKSLP